MPLIIEATERSRRVPIVAFVPIAVALAGIAVIFLGDFGGRQSATAFSAADRVLIDPVVTGAIAPRDHRHDMEMLDR